MMLHLSKKWAPVLTRQPETGMGYQVATVILQDGTKYNDLVIVGGIVTKVQGTADIPFQEQEIADIIVNPRES